MKYISFSILLLTVLFQISCNTDYRNRDSQKKTELKQDGKSPIGRDSIHVKPTISVYIENSASMSGYVNGSTQFKDALRELLVMLKYEYEESNIKVYFINSEIYPTNIKCKLEDLPSNLNINTISVGNTSSSNLNEVFKQVLSKTSKTNISILFSDCIYSINGENTEELLEESKTLTKGVFLSKSKENIQLNTTIIKLNSLFNGEYWDKSNRAISIPNKLRPYYICIIGENELMNDFNAKIIFDDDKIKGYENKSIITSTDYSKGKYFTVLTSTYTNGRFKPIKQISNSNYVGGIENVKVNSRSNELFSFAIALDLNDIPVEYAYITDTSNYKITNGNFTIDRIEKIEKKNIEAQDWLRIQNSGATHLVLLKANNSSLSNVTFELKKQLPKWIKESEPLKGELEYKEGKTFGFEYLVNGISEAYQTVVPDQKNYLSITIPIRKSSDSMIGKFIVILFILVALGSIFLIVIKNRKR